MILVRSAIAAMLLGISAAAAPVTIDPAAHELLQTAERSIEQATLIADVDFDQTRRLEREAAAAYRTLIEQHGVDTAAIHRNLGTIEYRLDNLGRAVLSLRRAQRLAPSDPAITDALDAARAKVRTRILPAKAKTAAALATRWRPIIDDNAMIASALVLWSLGWLALIANRWARLPSLAWLAGGLLGIGIVLGGLVGFARYRDTARDEAVIIAPEIVARRGPSEAIFEPAFDAPLTPGTEAIILEERTGWLRMKLANGSECWVPADAVERIERVDRSLAP